MYRNCSKCFFHTVKSTQYRKQATCTTLFSDEKTSLVQVAYLCYLTGVSKLVTPDSLCQKIRLLISRVWIRVESMTTFQPQITVIDHLLHLG